MKKSKNGSPKKSQLGKREAPNKISSLVQRKASLLLAKYNIMQDKKRRLAKLQKKKDKFKNKKLR